jgi:protein O-mannosyl-transferase
LYIIPVIIGFLVKEPAVMFAPLLMVYQLLFENKKGANAAKHPFHISNFIAAFKTSFVAFAVVLGLFVFSQLMTPKTWTSGNLDRWEYLISQPYVFIHYFNNFFLPFNLVIDTDWDFVKSITDDRFIIGFAFLIGFVFIIFKTAKKHPIIAFGLAWFLLTLLPSSSIIPLAEVLNDHRPFFGYIGLSLVSVYCLAYLYNRFKDKYPLRMSYMALTPIVLLLHGAGTYHQNKIWSSGESVWKEATIKSPKNGRAWMNYGNALMARGSYSEAQVAFDKALEVWPYYPYIFINRAVLRSVTNQDIEAEQDFKKALQLDSENPETYVCYGRFLLKRSRYEEALALLTQGAQKSTAHAELMSLKAEANLHVSNPQEFTQLKINQALERVKQNTTHETYLELSLAYYNASQFEECVKACIESLKLKPDYALAYNNMCSAHNQLKQWDKAIEAGEKGLQIEPQNELIKGNLKIAYAGKENK